MFPRYFPWLLAAIAMVAPVNVHAEDPLHIYLLLGQSNMAGRAPVEPEDEGVIEGAFLFNAEGEWEPAANPLNRYSTVRKGIGMQRLGPGYSFAQVMAGHFPAARIGMVVNARGGTRIEEWAAGEDLYRAAVERAKAAQAHGEIKGVLWHQGEGNSNDPDYLQKLTALIEALRADLEIPGLLFVAGQVEGQRPVNRQIARLAETVPGTAWVSSAGLATYDGTHFDSAAQREFGRRYAAEIIRLLEQRERMVPEGGTPLKVPQIRQDRPRLMFTPATLSLMKERIARRTDPWFSAAQALVAEAEETLAQREPAKPYTGRHSLEFHRAAVADGEKIRLFAYAWLITERDEFAEAARDHLLAWATAVPAPASDFDPEIRFPNTGMEVARAAVAFVEAYDLVAEPPAWSRSEREAVENWFRLLVEPILSGKRRWQENDYFNRQDFQNHLTAHTLGLAAIGYVLGDRELVQFALEHPENDRDFKTLIDGMILMEGQQAHHREPADAPPPRDGEIQDRYRHFTADGRGIQYVHLSLSQLLYTAELAWNNGIDFYRYVGSAGENLLLPLRFYADLIRTGDLEEGGGVFAAPGHPERAQRELQTLRARRDFPMIYEVGNRHYPNTPEIVRLLRSVDRVTVPRHSYSSFFYPVLSHGEPLEQ
jgi:hypothetical protein